MAAVTAHHVVARLAKFNPLAAGWALLDAAVRGVRRHPARLRARIQTLVLVVFPLVLAADAGLCTADTWRNGRQGVVLELLDWDEHAAIVVDAIYAEYGVCVMLLCLCLVRGDDLGGQDMLDGSRGQMGAALSWEGLDVVQGGVVDVHNTRVAQEVQVAGRDTLIEGELVAADATLVHDGVVR
jgi:hypothetical protein